MATALTAGDFEAAMNITSSTPMAADDRPLFAAGQEVFNADDFPQGASANGDYERISYTIDAIVLVPGDNAGATVLLDQLLDPANSADNATSRAVAGWQHTTTPGSTLGANTTSSPWFYDVKDANGQTVRRVHESKLTDLAAIKTYVGTDVSTGWA